MYLKALLVCLINISTDKLQLFSEICNNIPLAYDQISPAEYHKSLTEKNRFPQNFSPISSSNTFYKSARHVGEWANDIVIKYNFFHGQDGDFLFLYFDPKMSTRSMQMSRLCIQPAVLILIITLCYMSRNPVILGEGVHFYS